MKETLKNALKELFKDETIRINAYVDTKLVGGEYGYSESRLYLNVYIDDEPIFSSVGDVYL